MTDEEIKYYKKELEYITQNGLDVEKDEYYYIFPPIWYMADDLKLKYQILEEAIQNKKLIVDTHLYEQTMMEKVINNSKERWHTK